MAEILQYKCPCCGAEGAMAGKGTSIVEFVSTCSSGWKMSPEKANKWMEENMFPFYPLGDLKNKE